MVHFQGLSRLKLQVFFVSLVCLQFLGLCWSLNVLTASQVRTLHTGVKLRLMQQVVDKAKMQLYFTEIQ